MLPPLSLGGAYLDSLVEKGEATKEDGTSYCIPIDECGPSENFV